MPGGMGLGTPFEQIPSATVPQMGVSPDLGLNPAMNRGYAPIYRGNYNPMNPVGWTFQPPVVAAGATTGPADPMPRLEDFASPGKPITPEQQQRFNATMAAWQTRNPSGTSVSSVQGTGAPAPGPSPTTNPLAPPAAAYTRGDFIKSYEGPSLKQYGDQGFTDVGYGHLITPDERSSGFIKTSIGNVPINNITAEQQDAIFNADWDKYESMVKAQVPGYDKLNDNQKEALVSYTYNVGHFPTNMAERLNAGDMQGTSDLLRHGVATGVKSGYMPQLAQRRAAEADLFMLPEGQRPNLKVRPSVGGGTGTRTDPATINVDVKAPGGAGGPSGAGEPSGGYEPPPTTNTIADATIRRSLMLQMLGQALKGMKLTPMQVGYDPFKVQQAGQSNAGPIDVRDRSLDLGPRQSPVQTRYLPAPQPIVGGGTNALIGGMRRSDPGAAIAQSRMYENLFT